MRKPMTVKSYCTLAAVIFGAIALLQLWRALAGWPVVVNGQLLPLWASWVVVIVAGWLSFVGVVLAGYWSAKGGRRKRRR